MIAFYDDEDIDVLQLVFSSPNLANICLHKSTDTKSNPFTEGDEDLLEKFGKSLVVQLSFLHGKQLLMQPLFDNQQIFANLFLGLVPANYTSTRCVNPSHSVFTRVGLSIQRQVKSRLVKTIPVALGI